MTEVNPKKENINDTTFFRGNSLRQLRLSHCMAKPHIKKIDGYWYCTRVGYLGYWSAAPTPAQAYHKYVKAIRDGKI